MTREELQQVCEAAGIAAAHATAAILDRKAKDARRRHYGYKAIAAAIAEYTGTSAPAKSSIQQWTEKKRFPLNQDARGVFVTAYSLERWLDATAVAVRD